MANTKKRPNKRKKALLKILENSKDLETSKTVINERVDKTFGPTNAGIEAGVAHKLRPNKKRG